METNEQYLERVTRGWDLPGPAAHPGISHGLEFDHDARLVITLGIVAGHRIRTRVRPMSPLEWLLSEFRDRPGEELREVLDL